MSNNAGTGVLGSPISQNIIMAGPATGSDNFPSFRAQVIADLPNGIPTANMADPYSTDFLALQYMGSAIKGYTIGNIVYLVTSQPTQLNNGQGYYNAMYVPKPVTLTGLTYVLGTSGVYTATGYNGVALYSLNPATGLLTQVAASTTSGTIWSAAFGVKQTPFSATYNAAVGVYFSAFMFNASAVTTFPKILMQLPSATPAIMDFPNGIRLQGSQTATTLPATIASNLLTVSNNNLIFSYLY